MVDVCGGDGPHIRDVVDDLKRMQSLQRSYNEMSEELTKKDRLLAENDAQADPLAGPAGLLRNWPIHSLLQHDHKSGLRGGGKDRPRRLNDVLRVSPNFLEVLGPGRYPTVFHPTPTGNSEIMFVLHQ